jgi:outer membrane protein assembly factor BamB
VFARFDTTACLGVVPIFVNVGAAVLPAVLAALASMLALLLKPRELLRVCRARPHLPILVAAGAMGMYFGVTWLMTPSATAGRRTCESSGRTDWAQVALDIIGQRQRAAAASAGAPLVPGIGNPLPPAARVGSMIFRGDVSRSGYDGGPSPMKLRLLWSFSTENAMQMSSPLVANGAVFGASCVLDLSSNYGAVFCLDAATGARRWLVETATDPKTGKEIEFKGFFSSPALSADGKSLVIGQGLHVDADCDLLCFDADTGALRWRTPTPLHIESSPAIDGDLVVVGAGAIEGEDHKARGHPGLVIGVRLSDGAKLWEHLLNDPESSPAIADGVAYIGSGFNGNAVVALRTGGDEELKSQGLSRLLWKTTTAHPATGAITVAGDLVLVGCGNGDYVYAAPVPDGAVVALDRRTGAVRWQMKMPDAVLGAIAARDGRAVCPLRNGELAMLDLATGRILWRQEDPKERISGKAAVLCGPAFTGSLIYAVSQDGYLGVIEAAGGKVLQRLYINARGRPGEMGLTLASPLVVDGRVYVGSETGGLGCLVGEEAR